MAFQNLSPLFSSDEVLAILRRNSQLYAAHPDYPLFIARMTLYLVDHHFADGRIPPLDFPKPPDGSELGLELIRARLQERHLIRAGGSGGFRQPPPLTPFGSDIDSELDFGGIATPRMPMRPPMPPTGPVSPPTPAPIARPQQPFTPARGASSASVPKFSMQPPPMSPDLGYNTPIPPAGIPQIPMWSPAQTAAQAPSQPHHPADPPTWRPNILGPKGPTPSNPQLHEPPTPIAPAPSARPTLFGPSPVPVGIRTSSPQVELPSEFRRSAAPPPPPVAVPPAGAGSSAPADFNPPPAAPAADQNRLRVYKPVRTYNSDSAAMVKCQFCGTMIDAHSRQCSSCGNLLRS